MIITIEKTDGLQGHQLAKRILGEIGGQIYCVAEAMENEQRAISNILTDDEKFMAFTHHTYHATKYVKAPLIVEDIENERQREFLRTRAKTVDQVFCTIKICGLRTAAKNDLIEFDYNLFVEEDGSLPSDAVDEFVDILYLQSEKEKRGEA